MTTRKSSYVKHEIINGEKICGKCLIMKPISEFNKDRRNKHGLNHLCRKCYNLDSKARSKKWQLENKYGISLEDYNAMLIAQDNRCLICKEQKKLVLDHCHSTGAVRGLLCYSCNNLLGMCGDDINILAEAIRYLQASRGNFSR